MQDAMSGSTFGTLLVFSVITVTIFFVMVANMRTHLRSVPETAAILEQQFALANNELITHQASIADAERAIGELDRQVAQQQAALDERRQRLADARNRVPSLVFVLDQIIQQSHVPFLIPIMLEGATAADGDWINGRRYLVYGDDEANALRRIEARYSQREGYRCAPPEPFKVI